MRDVKAGPNDRSLYLLAYRRDIDSKRRLAAAYSAIALMLTPILRKHGTGIFLCAVFAACVAIGVFVVRSSPGWLKERLPATAVPVARVVPAETNTVDPKTADTVTQIAPKPEMPVKSRRNASRGRHSAFRTRTAQPSSSLYEVK